MARAYSLDLRKRVVASVSNGLSTHQAARQFSIGVATVGRWYRAWRDEQRLEPGRQGKPKRSKLDPYEAFILGLIETADRDITLNEIAERLASEHAVHTCVSALHGFFKKRGITYKKRRLRRASKNVPMF